MSALVSPFGIWFSSYRSSLGEYAAQIIAGETAATVLEVTRDGMLRCRTERGAKKTTLFAIPASQLVAVGFSPALPCDRDVTRTAPHLRFVTLAETVELPLHLDGPQGAALRDLLVAVMLHQWHDVVTIAQRASCCPYCGGVYVFTTGHPCPSCGGWPTQAVG